MRGHGRTKHWRKGRARRTWTLAAVLAVLALAFVAGALLFRTPFGGGERAPEVKTAAIVDQLGLTAPNPEFVREARRSLERAGYEVDYIPGEDVTVSFYRTLPEQGYDLIILRGHSGRIREEEGAPLTDDVTLFTSERLDEEAVRLSRYHEELADRRLVAARYFGETTEVYYGLTSGFVRRSMKGRFDGALVVMMGCDGLRSQSTAKAFLDRGASAFVSWSELVSAEHTDAATERLLQKLVSDGLSIDEAVAQTKSELGPDPAYGAELRVLARGG